MTSLFAMKGETVIAPIRYLIAETLTTALYYATLCMDATEQRLIVPLLIVVLFIAIITPRVTTSISSVVNIAMSLFWGT